MTEVFLQRRFDRSLRITDVLESAKTGLGCLDLYRVEWRFSALSAGGRQLLCHFSSADAESARVALRQGGADIRDLWPGTIHYAAGVPDADQSTANVIVQRRFEEPVTLEEIQAIEEEGAWCLASHQVTFLRRYFAIDRKRMLCLYRAPDAESVRTAQREAQMPVEQVWAFTPIQATG